jgi:hypothetical protein
MITVVPAASSDSAAIAQLWNAIRLDVDSCWHQAEEVGQQYIEGLLLAGIAISIAHEDDVPVGFGLWFRSANEARLVALAADDAEVYYRLMGQFCDWALAQDIHEGFAEIGTAPTTEKARMDALGVIGYVPIGFAPLEPDQNPDDRLPVLLRAQCDLEVLKDAVNQILEPAP